MRLLAFALPQTNGDDRHHESHEDSNINEFHGVVKNGMVKTPVGSVSANLGEGCAARVMIRPEAFRLVDGDKIGGLVLATVLERRLLGPSCILRLELQDMPHSLIVRVPGSRMPQTGEVVRIRLDPDQSFVFPASQKSSE